MGRHYGYTGYKGLLGDTLRALLALSRECPRPNKQAAVSVSSDAKTSLNTVLRHGSPLAHAFALFLDLCHVHKKHSVTPTREKELLARLAWTEQHLQIFYCL